MTQHYALRRFQGRAGKEEGNTTNAKSAAPSSTAREIQQTSSDPTYIAVDMQGLCLVGNLDGSMLFAYGVSCGMVICACLA